MISATCAEDLLERAQRNSERMNGAWHGRHRLSMLMGWVGAQMRRERQYLALGFATEKAYLAAHGIPESTHHRLVRVALAFERLTEEEFVGMKVDNALALVQLDEELGTELRYNAELMEAARREKIEEFALRLAGIQAQRTGLSLGETRVVERFRLQGEARALVLGGLKGWMRSHGIADEVVALEMLIAEYTNKFTVTGYLKDALGRLKMTSQIGNLEALRREVRSMAEEMEQALEIAIHGKLRLPELETETEKAVECPRAAA